MSVHLTPDQRQRLTKLLGLLGSNHAGERDAAGLAAHRLVVNAGTTWQDLLTPQVEHHQPEPKTRHDWRADRASYASWHKTVSDLLEQPKLLTPWEAGFLDSIGQRTRLTERQAEVLDDIVERVARRQAGRRA